MSAAILDTILKKYQEEVVSSIKEDLSSFGPKTLLRDAIEYALLTEGRRFRPSIVYMVAEAAQKGLVPKKAALAVEYFHTSSLIADDLPCMDNDTARRGAPTLHVAYGETVALLASYALISAGYQKIAEASRTLPDEESYFALVHAVENTSLNTGVFGATGGQFLDLFLESPSEAEIREVMEKKTGTLFEISFVFGWLFGGGEKEKLPLLKKVSSHFGLAFQIIDDFHDLEQDRLKSCPINYPIVVGEKKAFQVLHSEVEALFKGLETLRIDKGGLYQLACWLKTSVATLQQAPSLL